MYMCALMNAKIIIIYDISSPYEDNYNVYV